MRGRAAEEILEECAIEQRHQQTEDWPASRMKCNCLLQTFPLKSAVTCLALLSLFCELTLASLPFDCLTNLVMLTLGQATMLIFALLVAFQTLFGAGLVNDTDCQIDVSTSLPLPDKAVNDPCRLTTYLSR